MSIQLLGCSWIRRFCSAKVDLLNANKICLLGETGQIGPTGSPGEEGHKGPQGVKGDQGQQGPAGATGLQGPKGSTGVVVD